MTESATSPARLRLAELSQSLCHVPYSPQAPHPRQRAFLLDFGREALFGGAAGGGKSSAIIMAALQFVEVPGYSAILFRKSYADLAQPGALMDRADMWLRGRGPHWDPTEHTWTFPSGATLTFAYIERENDRLKYQGAEYQFIGFDELTQHKERDYRYLFSRLRRTVDNPFLARVPLRMRATTNPGGPGHDWVYRRFIAHWEKWKQGKAPKPARAFHPSMLSDNPSLDYDEYVQSLMELDPVTRAQLLRGDWNIRPEGRMFKRTWFKPWPADKALSSGWPTIRYWDLAATDATPGNDPDYTAGALITRTPAGAYVISDIRRFRTGPAETEERIRRTAEQDGRGIPVFMEQEPGASGKTLIHHFRTRVLPAHVFYGNLPSGSKVVRAAPVASQADAGNVYYVPGEWTEDFINEIEIFPDGEHDDQVDAVAGGIQVLAKRPEMAHFTGHNDDMEQTNPWDITAQTKVVDPRAQAVVTAFRV